MFNTSQFNTRQFNTGLLSLRGGLRRGRLTVLSGRKKSTTITAVPILVQIGNTKHSTITQKSIDTTVSDIKSKVSTIG